MAVITELRVRYGETDQMGVVYYGAYLDWFTEGRTDVLRRNGLSYRQWEERGVFLPVIEVGCRYLRPARYDDLLKVETRISELTPVQIRFDYRLGLDRDRLLAEGFTRHAFVGRDGKAMNLRKRHTDIWEWLISKAEEDLGAIAYG